MMTPGAFSSAVTRLFAGTWSFSWQAALLAVLVWLAQGLTRKWLSPPWRYRLWLLVVVRLLLPFSPASPLSIFNVFRREVPLALGSPVRLGTVSASPAVVPASTPVVTPATGPGLSASAMPTRSAANTATHHRVHRRGEPQQPGRSPMRGIDLPRTRRSSTG